jgi:predicted dehydrogenase
MANPTNIVSILSTRIEFGTAKVDSDLLWSTVVHDVSIVQYLLGNEPRKICAVGASLNEEKLKDIIFINLIFPSNVIGHISAGFAGPYRDRRLVLHTTQETIVFDGLNGNLELFTRKTSEANAAYGIREYEKQFGAGQKIELNKEEPLKVEGQHFIDCIKMNQAPQSGGENALAVMRTLDKIEKTLN